VTWDVLINRDAADILDKVNNFINTGGFSGLPEILLGQMPRHRLNPKLEKDINKFRRLLAMRYRVTPATVKNWLDGRETLSNREQVKEVGMALDMTETDLNAFLCQMKYRPLYEKNPMDGACIMVITKYSTVKVTEKLSKYRAAAKRAKRLLHIRSKKGADRATPARVNMQVIRRELDQVMTNDDFFHWVESKCYLLTTFSKDERTSWEIMNFVRLFLGNETTHSMWVNDRVSANVRNLLYDLNEDAPSWAKGLRNRFICFGLLRNFTATDIDDLLKIKGLPLVSEPESGFDAVLLEVIQKAHFRYPYEFPLLLRALEKIRHIEVGSGAYIPGGIGVAATLTRKAFYSERAECYKKRLRDATQFFNDYKNTPLSEEERVFAENATDDCCVADYAVEVLSRILELESEKSESGDNGILTAADVREIKEFLEVMKTIASIK